jgi:2-polyprenyl-6-methoxyphenol hydroxylase-like FAD-dependent oxidoreductase
MSAAAWSSSPTTKGRRRWRLGPRRNRDRRVRAKSIYSRAAPRGKGHIRLYVGRLIGDEKFTGPDKQRRFLEAFRTRCFPPAQELASAHPIGPCASFPMTDSWTENPVLEGVLLLGDAAGWSKPVTGMGLSNAPRDARVATDLLLAGTDWRPAVLSDYLSERSERMRRLRFATALTDLFTALGDEHRADRRRRMGRALVADPMLGQAIDAVHAGPWSVPADAFTPDKPTTLALC